MSIYNIGGFIGRSQRIREPITFVGGVSYSGSSTASISGISLTSLVGGLDTQPSKDDLVVVAFASASTLNRTLSCSGDVSGTYSSAHTELYQAAITSYDTNLATYYQIMGDTSDSTLTLTSITASASDAWAVVIHVWRYVDPANPLDVASTTASASSTTSANPPAITPSTSGVVILAIGAAAVTGLGLYFASSEDASLTFFTTWGNSTNDIGIGMGSYKEWVSGSYDPTVFRPTITGTSGSWAAATIALRPLYPPDRSSGIWSIKAKYNDSLRRG